MRNGSQSTFRELDARHRVATTAPALVREIELMKKRWEQGVEGMVCEHFTKGSNGATNAAKSMEARRPKSGSLTGKVAKNVYYASDNLPICIAKTRYSFSTEPYENTRPSG
jgi:formyltetrahydrofolate synthetase